MTKYTHGTHGTDAVPDRGMKHSTPLQETRMATTESGHRYDGRRSDIWSSIIHTPDEHAREVGKRRMSY